MSELILERIKENLNDLCLKGSFNGLDGVLKEAEEESLSYSEFLDRMLREEINWRTDRRTQTLLKMANFPFYKTIEDFDFSFQPLLPVSTIKEMATLSFMPRKENLVFLGPPGVGKSHLAIAIGIKAIQKGRKVYFTDLENLIKVLDENNHRRWSFLNKVSLLIIDEVGYCPMDRHKSHLFFKLISSKYEKQSLIITSNKSFREWAEVFQDEVLVTAILDRLLHHAIVINIRGQSYRVKDRQQELGNEKKNQEGEKVSLQGLESQIK